MRMEIVFKNGGKRTFDDVASFNVTEDKATEDKATQVAKRRAGVKCFDVTLKLIDRSLFQEKRNDSQQERARQIILEAFDEIDSGKYAKSFKVMIPKTTWISKTVRELKNLAEELGAHIADWVEWALLLAQRISNGETWESLCNDPATEEVYRLIVWKNGYCWRIGGSVNGIKCNPASADDNHDCNDCYPLAITVPLVVL